MKFKDTCFSREERFAIGIEEESGRYYLSIPVTNGAADYDEFYEISASDYQIYVDDLTVAIDFARQCKRREKDALLMMRPGSNRGIAS